jgi:general stress protein YciG
MEKKDPAAVSLGRKGGKARSKSRTAEELSEIGRKGAEARWGKPKKKRKPK